MDHEIGLKMLICKLTRSTFTEKVKKTIKGCRGIP
jgi:hypothetical protein